MRIGAAALAGYADKFKHVAGPFAGIGFRTLVMQLDHLSYLIKNRNDRIERSHRILENHRDLSAANGAHLRR